MRFARLWWLACASFHIENTRHKRLLTEIHHERRFRIRRRRVGRGKPLRFGTVERTQVDPLSFGIAQYEKQVVTAIG